MQDLRKLYFEKAKQSNKTVAMGVGIEPEMQDKCVLAVKKAMEDGIKNIVIVGKKLDLVKKQLSSMKIEMIENENPEEYLIKILRSGKIQGAVRGSLSAKKTVYFIKSLYNINSLLRMGPIDVSNERTFMLGPLGIDEGIDLDEKIKLVECMIKITQKIGIKPRIALMSLGRNEDVGRNATVDKSIKDVAELIKYSMRNGMEDVVYDTEILLENLDKINANCILAPTGYIGNIMYRCLVHLGCGKSYGGYICGLPDIFIDTSRGGSVEEYVTAIAMAKSGM